MYTRQEAFDRVWDWFITKENPQSVEVENDIEACLYRGPNGRKCALGVLIPDPEYQDGFERMTGHGVLAKMPDLFCKSDESFYLGLQQVHDEQFLNVFPVGAKALARHARALSDFADQQGLSVPAKK